MIRDNDPKFGSQFDRMANGTGMEVLKIPYRTPQANAICERFLGSVRRLPRNRAQALAMATTNGK